MKIQSPLLFVILPLVLSLVPGCAKSDSAAKLPERPLPNPMVKAHVISVPTPATEVPETPLPTPEAEAPVTPEPPQDSAESVEAYAQYSNRRYEYCITIPSTWNVLEESDNGDGCYIDSGNSRIDMRSYGSNNVLGLDWVLETFRSQYSSVEEFTFNDGALGYCAERDGAVIYMQTNGKTGIYFYLDYSQDMDWYEENAGRVIEVAKTLTYMSG